MRARKGKPVWATIKIHLKHGNNSFCGGGFSLYHTVQVTSDLRKVTCLKCMQLLTQSQAVQ